ncbi:MAG: hypothetical protein M3Y08_11285 [Fibrobacterota bacterium]|nr:hypothetical protein [Fibrobacterota bacterium]
MNQIIPNQASLAIESPVAASIRVDLKDSSPESIKNEIARTRAHMDVRLSDLGKKLKPRVNLKRLQIPAAGLFLALSGLLIFRAVRPRTFKVKAKAKVTRLKVKSAGMFDYLRTLKLLTTIVRKGKPAVFIVEPGKS